jgi:hypothetical protein
VTGPRFPYWWRRLHCRMHMRDWGDPADFFDDAGYCLDRYSIERDGYLRAAP